MKILKHGIKHDGKYIRCWYSTGALLHHPAGTITVYAKSCLDKLPADLVPENDSDFITDYVVSDLARVFPGSKYYADFKKHVRAS